MDNQYSGQINSTRYWDQRFVGDWKENNGIEQSQFFSRIAVENLPGWFIRYVQQYQPSFGDWGCAMGNGTRVMRDLLSLENITGIDFSKVAIEQARSSYPNIPFIAADILKDEDLPVFDVLFSSNTLEHFDNPWEILERLSRFARKFIVVFIPFKEYNRHFEHFYTFETSNIPCVLGASHYLAHFSIVNAAGYPSSYWNGHQILLIYSTFRELGDLGLTLSDFNDTIAIPPPVPSPAPEPIVIETVDHQSEIILEKISEIQTAQNRLQEEQTRAHEEQLRMQEAQLRAHEVQLRTQEVQKIAQDTLFQFLQSLRNEILAEKKERSFTARIRNLFSTRIRSKN